MSRARNIKPGFYKNEDLAECSVWARLLFPGLWMLADREGRLEDRPKRIKGEIFPFDSVEVEPLLAELVQWGFLVRYQVTGKRYIQVVNFASHQSPHGTEKDSAIPDEDGYLTVNDRSKTGLVTGVSHKTITAPPTITVIAPLDNGGLTVQAPLDNSATTVNPPCHNALNPDSLNPDSKTPPANAGAREAAIFPEDFSPGRDHIAMANNLGLDLNAEAEKFADHYLANGETRADWGAQFKNWLRRSVEYGGSKYTSPNARASPRKEKFDPVAFVNQGRKQPGGGNDGFIDGTAERVA